MIPNPNDTVLAVQDAFLDLLELADQVAAEADSVGSETLRAETQKTVLLLIAAVIVAAGKYESGEQNFVRALVDFRDKPGREIGFLNDYAARWAYASTVVPVFFREAARYDTSRGTEIARQMIRRIQLIGNRASISDRMFKPSEQSIVKQYVAFLSDALDTGLV